MAERQTEQPIEIVESFGGGAIKVEKEFDLKENREISYVNILGVRLRRRNSEVDQLPSSSDKAENFQDLTFSESDIHLLQAALMRYAIGHHTLFLSEPGFGKSTMMRFLAYLLNVPFHRVQCSHSMDVQKNFLWTAVRDNGKWKGRLGPLPQSMLDGGILLVDELPNLEPHEREIILEPTEHSNNPVIAKRAPELHIADFPGEEAVIQAQKGWFLVATGNYQEGQAIGEIHPFTEREERRVRLHALGALPAEVKPGRLAGRYRGAAVRGTALSQVVNTYHPVDIVESMPDAVIDTMANFFTAADQIIRNEILAQARQDPQVFLNETADRAFDHFMRFQIKKSATSIEDPTERIEEMIESAKAALQFYYVNSFREETKIKIPDALLPTFTAYLALNYSDKVERKKYLDAHDRAQVREYLKWRIGMLSSKRFYKERKEVGGEVKIIARHLREQLKKIMGLEDRGVEVNETKRRIGEVQDEILRLLNTPAMPATEPPAGSEAAGEPDTGNENEEPEPPEGHDPDVPALDTTVRDSLDGVDNAEVIQNFEAQYAKRLVNLKYFGIISEINNPVITGIDNQQYRAPTFNDIKTKLLKPAFLEKVKKFKKPMLLLTPIGMFLKTLAEKVGSKRGRLQKHKPVSCSWELNADETGELVYFPQRYEQNNHGGMTKRELLSQGGGKNLFPGWSVTVIEGADEIDTEAIKIVPPPSDPNASKYKNAHMFAQELKNGSLSGLTPEEWLILHAERVARGKPFESSNWTWLLAAYHSALRAVPVSFFIPAVAAADVDLRGPGDSAVRLGARRSARE